MPFFLDTEWQNDESRDLVSMALLSDDGRRHFYAERDPLPETPSDFVRDVVFPLLGRGSAALSDDLFTQALRTFIAEVKNPEVLADSPTDFRLLSQALSGFGAEQLPPPPPWRPKLISDEDVQRRIEDYFVADASARARRHHALVDAEALRWAFQGLVQPAGWGAFE